MIHRLSDGQRSLKSVFYGVLSIGLIYFGAWAIALTVVLSLLSVPISAFLWWKFGDETNSIREWNAVRAAITQEARETPLVHLVFQNQKGYHLVGLFSKEKNLRLWIVLDPKYKPWLKQLPEGNYQITPAELEEIKSYCKVHPLVLKELSLHISEQPKIGADR